MTNLRAEWETANYSIHPNGSECCFSEKPHERLVNRLYYVNQRNRSNHRRANNVMWSLYDSFIHSLRCFESESTEIHGKCATQSSLVGFWLFPFKWLLKVIVIPSEVKASFVFNRPWCAHFVLPTNNSLLHVPSRQRLIFYRLIDRIKADDAKEKFSTQKSRFVQFCKARAKLLVISGRRQETVKKLELRYYSKESHGYATRLLNWEMKEKQKSLKFLFIGEESVKEKTWKRKKISF